MSRNVVAGPEIVTDNLQLYLDAGNAQSYPGSGTVWYDISGNGKNGTIYGATYNSGDGGHFVFDGTDDYVNVSSPPKLKNYSTMCIWFESTQSSGSSQGGSMWDISCRRTYNDFVDDFSAYINADNDLALWGLSNDESVANYPSGRNDYSALVTGEFASDSTWHYLCLVFNSGLSDVYLDGVYRVSENSWGWEDFDEGVAQWIWIGRHQAYHLFTNYWSKYWLGKLNGVQLYHKALTAAEVLQNYNAHKARYGL